jgi:hypothetical protein
MGSGRGCRTLAHVAWARSSPDLGKPSRAGPRWLAESSMKLGSRCVRLCDRNMVYDWVCFGFGGSQVAHARGAKGQRPGAQLPPRAWQPLGRRTSANSVIVQFSFEAWHARPGQRAQSITLPCHGVRHSTSSPPHIPSASCCCLPVLVLQAANNYQGLSAARCTSVFARRAIGRALLAPIACQHTTRVQ